MMVQISPLWIWGLNVDFAFPTATPTFLQHSIEQPSRYSFKMASTVPVARAVTGDSVEITTMPTTTLAMSSIFTAPASCSSSWTYEPQGANDVPNGLLMQNAATKDNADPACFPSGYSQYGRIRPTIAYSPGYCPGGYTSADLVIHSPATTAMCCPS